MSPRKFNTVMYCLGLKCNKPVTHEITYMYPRTSKIMTIHKTPLPWETKYESKTQILSKPGSKSTRTLTDSYPGQQQLNKNKMCNRLYSVVQYCMAFNCFIAWQCDVRKCPVCQFGLRCTTYRFDSCDHILMMSKYVLIPYIQAIVAKFPNWLPEQHIQGKLDISIYS